MSPTPGAARAHLWLLKVLDACADPTVCVGTGGGSETRSGSGPRWKHTQAPSSAPVPGRGPGSVVPASPAGPGWRARTGFLLPRRTTAAQHHLPLGSAVGSGSLWGFEGLPGRRHQSLWGAGTRPMSPQGGGPAPRGGHGRVEADTQGNDEFLLLRSSESPHGRRWTPLTHDGDFTARQNDTTRRGGRWRGSGPVSHPRCPFPSPARGRGRAVPLRPRCPPATPACPAAGRWHRRSLCPKPGPQSAVHVPGVNPGKSGTSGRAIQTKLVGSPG